MIAPLEARKLLDREKILCIVPDKALNHLPFNALISTKTDQYLIDEYTLTFAPSSSVYLQCTEWARQRSGKNGRIVIGGWKSQL
jgi:CHAT domain-containing protein